MCGMFDLNVWDNDAEYLVLDDIPFDYVGGSGMRKALWGAQREIVLSDKFHRKRTVTWGKPLIFLGNEGDRISFITDTKVIKNHLEREWYEESMVEVVLARGQKMYITGP